MPNPPPVFLLAFANDRESGTQYLRNVPHELRLISEALDQAKAQGLCDYIYLANATLTQILDTFQKAEYRNRIAVFHYGGHANSLQILLESSDGRVASADAGGLAVFLGQQRGLKLVFLNGCSTKPQVEALLDANVSMVIATSQAIVDQVAMEFANRFYRGLAGGVNVQSAYKEAEGAVRSAGYRSLRNFALLNDHASPASIQEERCPWDLYFKKGADAEGDWNLPTTVDKPLFGLPNVPPGDLPAEPFRRLSWFALEHAEIFFGRDHQIRDLYDRLTETNGSPIVLLYGQAGVGKSSLLDAGLAPRLKSTHEFIYLRRKQELKLLGTVRHGLGPDGQDDLNLGSAWLSREEQTGKPLALVLDQVEEVFTRPSGDAQRELKEFLGALEEAFAIPQSRPRGKLILGFRKEWESEIEYQLKEYRLPHAKVFLQPLNSQGVIQAVTGVTNSPRLRAKYGLEIEEGLPELIAGDLSVDPDSPTAPTLQVLLTKMWEEAIVISRAKPLFDLALYRQLKTKGILLGDFLDQQLAKLKESQPEVVDSGLALDALAYHTTAVGTAEQRSDLQIKQEYQHQLTTLSPLLEKLKELYLIADPPQDQRDEVSARATRLAHDTLAPLVRARYDKSVLPGQRARRVLENRSPDWQGAKDGLPLDERDLKVVEAGASGMRDWTTAEKRLIEESRRLLRQRARRRDMVQFAAIIVALLIVSTPILVYMQQSRVAKVFNELEAKQQNELRVKQEELEKTEATADTAEETDRSKLANLRSLVPKFSCRNVPEQSQAEIDMINKLLQINCTLYHDTVANPEEVLSSPRIYFEIQSQDQFEDAWKLRQWLSNQVINGRKPIVLGIDNVGPRKLRTTQLRYFHDNSSEIDFAWLIVNALKNVCVDIPQPQLIKSYEDSTAIGPLHFELWLTPDALSNFGCIRAP